MLLDTTDGTAVLAYAGLGATAAGTEPSDWMSATLNGLNLPMELMRRRHIAIDGFDYIGKESNKLEQVEEGCVQGESDIYTIYADPRRDEWETKWLPILRSTPVPTLERQGVSRATIFAARAGRKPYGRTKAKLIAALKAQAP